MKVSLVALAALLVVACNSQDKGRNAAGNQAGGDAGAPSAAGPAAGAASMQPGQWEMVTRIASIEMPGATPEQQAQIQQQQPPPQTERTCITPEEAANPLARFRESMSRDQQGFDCQGNDDNVFAGGVVRIGMTCRSQASPGDQTRLAMVGQFTATTVQAAISVDAQAPSAAQSGGPTAMRIRGTITGRRMGDCPAGAAATGNE